MTTSREAARIIADLLTATLMDGRQRGRKDLYSWERDGLLWLRDQWERDPETQACFWAHTAMTVLLHGGNPLTDPIR